MWYHQFKESSPMAIWLNQDPQKRHDLLMAALASRGIEVKSIEDHSDSRPGRSVGIIVRAKSFGRVSITREILEIGEERLVINVMYEPDGWASESTSWLLQSSAKARVMGLFATNPVDVLRSIKVDGQQLDGVGASPSNGENGTIDVFGRAEDLARLGDTIFVDVDEALLEFRIVKFPL